MAGREDESCIKWLRTKDGVGSRSRTEVRPRRVFLACCFQQTAAIGGTLADLGCKRPQIPMAGSVLVKTARGKLVRNLAIRQAVVSQCHLSRFVGEVAEVRMTESVVLFRSR